MRTAYGIGQDSDPSRSRFNFDCQALEQVIHSPTFANFAFVVDADARFTELSTICQDVLSAMMISFIHLFITWPSRTLRVALKRTDVDIARRRPSFAVPAEFPEDAARSKGTAAPPFRTPGA